MDEKRRAAGEQDLIGLQQLPPQPPEQGQIGARRPESPGTEVRAIVEAGADADDSQTPLSGPLLLNRVRRRGEAGEDHVLSRRRALAGEEEAVLADGPEVRRQPVTEVDQLVHAVKGSKGPASHAA